MRTLWLMFLTVVVVAILAGVYVWIQPAPVALQNSVVAPTTQLAVRPVPSTNPTETQSVLQGGQDVWVKVYDEKSDRLAWQFRFAQHEPQPDGSINLTRPQAEFFMQNGQVVAIEGSRGHVIVPAEATKDPGQKGPTPIPSRGELFDVVITMYPSATEREHPSLVCKVNNVSFDNDTLRLATESFTEADGTVVAADQVPVQMRGDCDLDGKGLTIRWNERDRRLQMLQIDHGEKLTFNPNHNPMTAAGTPSTQPQLQAAAPARRGGAIAVAAGRSGGNKPATSPATREHLAPPIYHAMFDGGVKLSQAGEPLATGETLAVDFVTESGASPTTKPSQAGAGNSRTSPATRPAARVAASPTTKPLNQNDPYTVQWPGKLVIVPIENETAKLQPGQFSVEMTSKIDPVVLTPSGSEIRCDSFSYNGVDDSLIVKSSSRVPLITVKDTKGGTFATPLLTFNGTEQRAVFKGPSSAEIPMANESSKQIETLKAQWADSCIMTLVGPSHDKLTIRRADMSGDVKIDHPGLKLASQTLSADFAPPTNPNDKNSVPPLKQVDARGDVDCSIVQDPQKSQRITAQSLRLVTEMGADGKLAPRSIVADGQVHSFDPAGEQELRAGHLEAMVAQGPTTQPSDVRLQSLIAQRDVVFKFAKASGTASQLEVNGDPQDQNSDLKLTGQPASVVMEQGTLKGSIINVHMKSQTMEVIGPGSLLGAQPPTKGEAAKPFDVSWTRGLSFDVAGNLGQASGQVSVKTVGPDHSQVTAGGEKLVMELMEAAESTTKPSTRAATSAPAGFEAMAHKTLKTLIFDGNSQVEVVALGPDQTPSRRTNLFAPMVRFEVDNNNLIVPSAGQMLFEDLRPPAPPAAQGEQPSLGELNGPTAFAWSHQLEFNSATHRAEMLGDVRIVHDNPAKDAAQRFEMQAQRVIAEFAGVSPTSQPADAGTSGESLKRLTADGNVTFTSDRIQFSAAQLDMDSANDLLTASGADGVPVQIYDANSTGTVQRASWNTRTRQIVDVENLQARIRR
ncbi:MAG TPA: hypothetical protein VHD56_16615 [Tepidisphaeraceae bacterium]|nr:hypothetical protein [Tepidisphaeraceae bacterium]